MTEVNQIISSFDADREDVLVREAIDNLRFIGDVGDTELHILERVLSHCTMDQLMHVEKSSKGRDLTPVTNGLWKNFYERRFGKDETEKVQQRIKDSSFRWKEIYEAKLKKLEVKGRKIEDRTVQIYQKEKARKQSRQVKICPISSSSNNKKRSFEKYQNHRQVNHPSKTWEVSSSGSNNKRSFETTIEDEFDNSKSKSKNLFDKARKEANKSLENKNHIVYKRNAIQKS